MGSHSILQAMAEADHTVEDPGSAGRVVVDRSPAIWEVVTAGAEGRLLSDPTRAGQVLIITAKTLGGNAIILADTAMNVSGHNYLTFDTAADTVMLVGVNDASLGLRWQVVANENGAFS